MKRKRLAFLVLSLFAPLLLVYLLLDAAVAGSAAHAAPAVAPVVDTLADENDGSCADGDCSLRDAIATATAGDAITFSVAGTIVLSPTLGDLDIGQDLTIDGGGLITVSGGDATRVFNVTGGEVTFDSLTIADGNVQTHDCGGFVGYKCGGGIILQNSSVAVTVTNSTLSGNSADTGGGIYNYDGSLTVSNSTLSANSANYGGGICNDLGSSVTLINSTLSANSANYGGGIANDEGSVTVNNSTLTGNSAGSGGGIAGYGSGATSTTLSNTVVSGNVLSGTTTADDLALYAGSTNSFHSAGYNLIGDVGDHITLAGPGDLTGVTDPLLGPLADNGGDTLTHALLPGSLAIDNGECSSGPAADQRGVVRPQDDTCDSGAFESRGFDLAMSGGSPQSTMVNTPFAEPLALTVSSAYAEPVGGGQVTFLAPASDAGLTFTEMRVAIGGGGAASLPVTANCTAGSYQVTADTSGNNGAGLTYDLTNDPVIVMNNQSSGPGSLREAIAVACPGDLITFDSGLAGSTIDISPDGELRIAKSLTISATVPITISGGDATRVFYVTGGDVTFEGLTIADGSASSGGGIFSAWSTLTVSNSTLSGNSAGDNGGGIWNQGGTVEVSTSTLSGNSAFDSGGGIYTIMAIMTVSDSELSGNSAGNGGGIYNYGSTVEVSTSTLSGNSAFDSGGGIYTMMAIMTVSDSELSGNSAGNGGGIYNYGSTASLTVTSSTLSGNFADQGGGINNTGGSVTVSGSILSGNEAVLVKGLETKLCNTDLENSHICGGGIFNWEGSVEVSNSTFSANSAWSDEGLTFGGGIHNEMGIVEVSNSTLSDNSANYGGGGILANWGSTTIGNSIVSGNVLSGTTTADDLDGYGAINSAGYNLFGVGAIGGPDDLTGVTDPLLGPLADNGGDTWTHALLPGSLAIDNGECSGGPPADERGVPRPQDGDCDSGAFESRGFSLAMSGGSLQSTYAGFPFADPLALTVSSAYAEPVEGGQVTFSAPLSGAGLTFTETVAAIGGGLASLPVTANSTAGGPYQVFADTGGNIGVELAYELTNLPVTQTRTLNGWRLVSSYVQPADADFATVMAPVAGQLVLAKNGRGEVYWAAYGIDQIGEWSAEEGYQVYVSEGATWTITGGRIDPVQSPMELAAGWNMVAYLRETPLAIGDALATISSELYLVKDGDGNVYWPDLPLDDIGEMQPGRGYQIYLNGPATLTYPAN